MKFRIIKTTTKHKVHISVMLDGDNIRQVVDWDDTMPSIENINEMWAGDQDDKDLVIHMLEEVLGIELVPKQKVKKPVELIPSVKV